MLGLIREGDGVAAQVLVKLGADLNRVRQQVIQLLADSLDRRLAAIERWVGLRPDLDDLDQEIARVRREKEAAIGRQDFEAAAALLNQEKQLLAARAGRDKEWAEPLRPHTAGPGTGPGEGRAREASSHFARARHCIG